MSELSCENEFCIYQEHEICILESVHLDIQGNCLDCVYIHLEKNALKNLKEKLLRGLQDLEL